MSYPSPLLKRPVKSLRPSVFRRGWPIFSAALLLLSLLLTACGESSQGSSNITLKLITWNNPATVKALTQLDNEFHQQYPNITVKPTIVSVEAYDSQLLPTRLQANDVDIFSSEGGFSGAPQSWSPGAPKPAWQQEIDAKQVLDLSDQPFIKNFYASAIQNASTYNGKVYSVPGGLVTYTGMLYNKDLFSKYNLQVPKTYDDLIAVCAALKAKGVTPITTGGKEIWPLGLLSQSLMATYSADQPSTAQGLWTGNTKFTDPKFVELLQHTQKILGYMENNFMGEDTAAALGRFANGQAAMLITGSWDAPTALSINPALKMGYFPTPLSNTASDNSFLNGKYADEWYIAAHSKHQDAALKWLNFFSDPKHYVEFASVNGILPVQDISASIPLSEDLKPYMTGFKLAWDQVMIQPTNIGKYASGGQPHLEFLAPAGPLTSVMDLAQKTQSDWQSAVHK